MKIDRIYKGHKHFAKCMAQRRHFWKRCIYKHKTGKIEVIYVSQYRNVEFIFGVPLLNNKYSIKGEKAFFEIRRINQARTIWFYIDKNELEDFEYGFRQLKIKDAKRRGKGE